MTRKHTLNPTPESCQFARQKFLGVDSLEAAKPLDVECNAWFLWYWEPLLFRCCFKQYFEFRFVGCMLAIRLDLVYLSLSIYIYMYLFIYIYTHLEFEDYLLSHVDWLSLLQRNYSYTFHLTSSQQQKLRHFDAFRCNWSKLRWKVKPMIGPFHCNGQQIFRGAQFSLLFSEKLMQIQIWWFGVFVLYDLFLGISFWLGSFCCFGWSQRSDTRGY